MSSAAGRDGGGVVRLVHGGLSRGVDQRHDRDVVAVAQAHKARGLLAGAGAQRALALGGVVGHDADRAAAQARKRGDMFGA